MRSRKVLQGQVFAEAQKTKWERIQASREYREGRLKSKHESEDLKARARREALSRRSLEGRKFNDARCDRKEEAKLMAKDVFYCDTSATASSPLSSSRPQSLATSSFAAVSTESTADSTYFSPSTELYDAETGGAFIWRKVEPWAPSVQTAISRFSPQGLDTDDAETPRWLARSPVCIELSEGVSKSQVLPYDGREREMTFSQGLMELAEQAQGLGKLLDVGTSGTLEDDDNQTTILIKDIQRQNISETIYSVQKEIFREAERQREISSAKGCASRIAFLERRHKAERTKFRRSLANVSHDRQHILLEKVKQSGLLC